MGDENVTAHDILITAESYGFNLEFKVASFFEKLGYSIESNKRILTEDSEVEVDLIAQHNVLGRHIIIECKGAIKNKVLVLVEQNNRDIFSSSDTRLKHQDKESRIPLYDIENSLCISFTGDFFEKNQKNGKPLKQSSRNEDDNQFYKAQKQILKALKYYEPQGSDPNAEQFVIPIIVTNACIWSINYSGEQPQATKRDYALHYIANFEPKIPFAVVNGAGVSDQIPCLIVNIGGLSEVIQCIEKAVLSGTHQKKIKLP